VRASSTGIVRNYLTYTIAFIVGWRGTERR
jgi:hypothetical protein